MLFAKSTAAGIRVSGYVEQPSLVLITCKASNGESHVVPFVCDQIGPISHEITVKGFEVEDCVGIPVLKTRRTLYVHRPVVNADEIISWFKSQGMVTMLAPEDMHVTIAFSKTRVDWEATGDPEGQDLEIQPDLKRSVSPLGTAGAVVMHINSPDLSARWSHLISKGASWDYDGYRPHITLTYSNVDAGLYAPFPGTIRLGGERWAQVDTDWVASHV